MAVFSGAVGGGDLADQNVFSISLDNLVEWNQPVEGSDVAVLAALSYAVDSATLSQLTRSARCNGTLMASLGVIAWNGLSGGGWTEVFGITGVTPGRTPPRMTAAVEGATDVFGINLPRVIRGSSLAFTGVDSFGTVTTVSGTGTALSVAGSATPASMIAAFFGTRSGLSNANKTQRYLNNTSTSLLISEARGTGASFNLTASRAVAGPWSAISVVLNPADQVASVQPLVVAPALTAAMMRLPRPTPKRRVTFDVEPED
ncbi:hypothetical protein B1R94_25900 [Mycolicibacterium litorale]|nr:hypothetical protein B1R94_25900 [Mycolicibacterium litorale]